MDKAGLRVLVAEDEPAILRNIVRKVPLADPGCTVVATAEDGSEALRLVRELEPDLVLTDIVMPRMDGLELAAAVRSERPSVAVAIVSGYGEFEYARRAISLGVEHYLLKPLKVEALRGLLRKVRLHRAEEYRARGERGLRCAIQAGGSPPPEGGVLDDYLFMMVCVGGLMAPTDSLPPALCRCAAEVWTAIERSPALLDRPRVAYHWLVEAGLPNQRLLAIRCGKPEEAWIRECAALVLETARAPAYPFAASVCTHRAATTLTRAYAATQELRRLLDACVVPGAPRLCMVGEQLLPDLDPPLGAAETSRIVVLRESACRDPLLAEISALLERWTSRRWTQRALEKGLDQLAEVVAAGGTRGARPEETARRLRRAVADCVEGEPLVEKLTRIFDEELLRPFLPLDGRAIVERVEAELAGGFSRQISLEAISRAVGFDLSYVSRLFRRRLGKSPVRYLREIRIGEAKRLLLECPDLEVGSVGAMVGYPDPHYFARVFKKATGLRPSAYRAGGSVGDT